MAASTRAELLRVRAWPAFWVMLGVWMLLNFTFAYLFNYLAYATESENFATEGMPRQQLLDDLMPAAVPQILTSGMPMFGGAIMLILGALVTGSGYGWGTWKTVAMQGPGRLAAFGGTLVTLAVTVIATVLATLALDLGVAALIGVIEADSIPWPAAAETVRSVGGGLLIFGMWTAAGALIGVLTRSPALAVGLGLVWSLVVENLLRGVAELLAGIGYVTDVLPGTAAGSVAGALGADASSGGAPGVLEVLDGGPAAAVTGAYLVVFAVLAAVVHRRRDLV
ncbi:ABC transporter permease [Phytoactinopolyspora halotolerans]|uniref:ABC transporter permease n=1 Tax=Phytoactinopolyspora halotolerans TaxID=1981512 RepID=A0A6L9SAF8_9ACTN|nr:ABC transporter permease [Phytoactinopolyspora halotolerans]